MIISIPKEITPGENRVAVIPATVKEYIKKGNTVQIEAGAGAGSFISDEDFKAVGAEIVNETKALYENADIILKVNSPIMNQLSYHVSQKKLNGYGLILKSDIEKDIRDTIKLLRNI